LDQSDDLQKLTLIKQNLDAEKDFNQQLNIHLNYQLESAKTQSENLILSENNMNELKLKMLLKFDQIKLLEDFYNHHYRD
jgi:hypothetical protein